LSVYDVSRETSSVSTEVRVGEIERRDVIASANELGVAVTELQATRLLDHLGAVLESNKRLNLTAIVDRERAIRLHIVDSLAVVSSVASSEGTIADIGSGAGFPGISVAIVTHRPVDLIESVKKKAAFLDECVVSLGGLFGSRVLAMRAEEAALVRENRYEHVTARALTSLPSLVELASPLLVIGGMLWAMKGAPTTEELEAGVRAAGLVGMREVERRVYTLPSSDERRLIVGYAKISEPTLVLPRRVGLAQKRPLA
jgi:16S rRNA (guanine527-N7)-methyltransferase